MSSNVLADRDVNTSGLGANGAMQTDVKQDIKSMEYHRKVLQSKLEDEKYAVLRNYLLCTPWLTILRASQTYISPSDNIMSPCTAKLSAYRGKQVAK